MNIKSLYSLLGVVLANMVLAGNVWASYGRLSPRDFNKMYYLASSGKVGILRDAVNRGLNIDSLNPNGDTGLCIAVKKKDYIAYNSFRMSGANPKHACTYRMYDEYKEFLEDSEAVRTDKIAGNLPSLYYDDDDFSFNPWIWGGLALGGAAIAFGGSDGSGSDSNSVSYPVRHGDGLATMVQKAVYSIDGTKQVNSSVKSYENPNAKDVVDNIKLFPNVQDNTEYFSSLFQVRNGGVFENGQSGALKLGNASFGATVSGENSKVYNSGLVEVTAQNGSVGLLASNGGTAINNAGSPDNLLTGKISMVFKGAKDTDVVAGMYADTNSKIINFGNIEGVTSEAENIESETENAKPGSSKEVLANAGDIIGMALFDLYTGKDLSKNTVYAENYGNIILSAGNNKSLDTAVGLIGMGSYIDESFLNSKNDPRLAENMKLDNYGNIHLSYQGAYVLKDNDLKLGEAGLIGMRSDGKSVATNKGNIVLDLTSIEKQQNIDVGAGMLSVHGGKLVNGDENNIYSEKNPQNIIQVINEASLSGKSFGMLASKGTGLQTGVYWNEPKLLNYGLIDMQASNSSAMASFAGGEVINYGVINVGVENGHSRYNKSYGLFAAGDDKTKEVLLQNVGTINVNAELSKAIYNEFAGSVKIINDGNIYISNKATGSMAFGGKFSTAINNGTIIYKVGNSEYYPEYIPRDPQIFYFPDIMHGVVNVSSDDKSFKQYFENNGDIILGEEFDEHVDYGGTYETAAVLVANQGGAVNNGTIVLNNYIDWHPQFNVGMYLTPKSTAEAYVTNNGVINVNSSYSIGMSSASEYGAKAINLGKIVVGGDKNYGMASITLNSHIYNGLSSNNPGRVNEILLVGKESIGMYIKGYGYNYGKIKVGGTSNVAYRLDGDEVQFYTVPGGIEIMEGAVDAYMYQLSGGAKMEYLDQYNIENYTLAMITGGKSTLGKQGKADVKGINSRLFKAIGDRSEAQILGSLNVSSGAIGVHGLDEAFIILNNGGHTANVSTEGSIGFKLEGAKLDIAEFSNITVRDGAKGVQALTKNDTISQVRNNAEVVVEDGIGIEASGKTDKGSTMFTNLSGGKVKVIGEGSKGVYVSNGAIVENSGQIVVERKENCSENLNTYGIYAVGAEKIENKGVVTGNFQKGSVGVYLDELSTFRNTGGGSVNYLEKGIVVDNGAKLFNDSLISNNGIGVEILSGSGVNDGIIEKNDTGVHVLGGKFENKGTITSNKTGILVEKSGVAENKNIITVSGSNIGVSVKNGGVFENLGTINVSGGTGIVVNGENSIAINSKTGIITYSKNKGVAYREESGGKFVNNGKIQASEVDQVAQYRQDGDKVYSKGFASLGHNAEFINSGEVEYGNDNIDFDLMTNQGQGKVIIGKNGKFEADSFKGNVIAGKDLVMNGFENTYENKNSFVGQNDGLSASSESYMFDAHIKTNQDIVDVELNRKKFEELIDDENVANFFETNYQLHNNEKMFNVLKSAENKKEFDAVKEMETGEKFYANINRENMAVMRGINSLEQNRLLNEGITGKFIGADFYRTGKDGNGNLSGYDDDIYSAYLSGGEKLNKNWSMGGTLRLSYADSDYSDINSNRNNKILMAFLPIMYQNNNFKFLTMPEIGVGYGKYKRHAYSDDYEADTLDFYYGLYNHAEYSVDMKVAELVTEAELNLQGMSISEAKEDEGLKLRATDSVSLEAGIGLKLRKKMQLAKSRSLMIAVGTKYYQELLDPYGDVKVGMDNSPVNMRFDGYNEDKKRLKTSVEALYKDNDFSIAAEVSHNAEEKDNIEGGIGVRYSF